jgi:hypothetical protein
MIDSSSSTQLVEIGVISPSGADLPCGKCKESIVRYITKPDTLLTDQKKTVCPHFCSMCESWYHPSCLPDSCVREEVLYCPTCHEKKLKAASFYCEACAQARSVHTGTHWPLFSCAHCGKPTSLAALYFVGGGEIVRLVIVGAATLVLFILALAFDTPHALKIAAGSLAALFALPWLLMLFAVVIKELMPMGLNIGEIGVWGGGIENLLVHQAQEFETRSVVYRFAKVYLWAVVTAFSAAIVIVIGLTFIHFLLQSARSR